MGSGKSLRLLSAELKGNKDWVVVYLGIERYIVTTRARGLLYGLLDDLKRKGLIEGLRAWRVELGKGQWLVRDVSELSPAIGADAPSSALPDGRRAAQVLATHLPVEVSAQAWRQAVRRTR
ncbi:hypothetical protein [Streptomyces sp. st140]|uniref:hypothetical protein n=1 Tax=Streptomyces sp. st140 TaxID=1828052 RepID=UPI00118164D9|nr:hypothetical protein [Streptomyces sp. st140]